MMSNSIIYIAFVKRSHLGVYKKILEQVSVWKLRGYEVTLITDIDSNSLIKILINRYKVLFRFFVLNRDSQCSIYLRQTLSLPFFSSMLKRRAFSYEINADLTLESIHYTKIKRVLTLLSPQNLQAIASSTFYVSKELAERLHPDHADLLVFPNSLTSLPAKHFLPRGSNVVFVGNPSYIWQGFDHFLSIVEAMPQYKFHVVGADSGPYLPNLIYLGILTGDSYARLMESMDFAVGTLAFYRTGISEGSPLKVRDYVSFNLPFIVGYNDSDFSKSDFCLQINPENLVDQLPKIHSFFTSWKNRSIELENNVEYLKTNRESRRADLIASR